MCKNEAPFSRGSVRCVIKISNLCKKIQIFANRLCSQSYPMNTKQKNFNELDHLVSKVLDDNFSTSELDRLSFLLKESKRARERYSELALQESLLHWESGDCIGFPKAKVDSRKISFWPVFSSFAAAIVALFAVWWLHSENMVDNSLHTQQIKKIALSEPIKKPISPFDVPRSLTQNPKSTTPNLFFSYNTIFSRSKPAQIAALNGIEILRQNKNFGEGGSVLHGEKVSLWSRTNHLSVPMENGVSPKDGSEMLKFSPLSVDVDSQTAEVSETVQVLDVRKIKQTSIETNAEIQTSLFFNQGYGLNGDSTEFSLSFHAIASNNNAENTAIGHKTVSIASDENPTTWEEVRQEYTLPAGTEFVIVSMCARKDGSSALLPDTAGHYADGFSINLLVNGENVIGPL